MIGNAVAFAMVHLVALVRLVAVSATHCGEPLDVQAKYR
jgi:hypothetical protein